jgi:hypothetical protein
MTATNEWPVLGEVLQTAAFAAKDDPELGRMVAAGSRIDWFGNG